MKCLLKLCPHTVQRAATVVVVLPAAISSSHHQYYHMSSRSSINPPRHQPISRLVVFGSSVPWTRHHGSRQRRCMGKGVCPRGAVPFAHCVGPDSGTLLFRQSPVVPISWGSRGIISSAQQLVSSTSPFMSQNSYGMVMGQNGHGPHKILRKPWRNARHFLGPKWTRTLRQTPETGRNARDCFKAKMVWTVHQK